MLGAGILAPNAGEMIGLWALAIARRVKLSALASLIVPYPTRTEAGKRAAGNFFVPRLFAPAHQGAGPPAGTVAVSGHATHLAAMGKPQAGPPRVRPRQSLSGRLWLVATLAVLLSEIVVFLPYIAHERSSWLYGRIEDASIAMLAAANGTTDMARHDELLRLSGAEAIQLTERDGAMRSVGNVTLPTGRHDRPSAGESAGPYPPRAPRRRAPGEPPDQGVGRQPVPALPRGRGLAE